MLVLLATLIVLIYGSFVVKNTPIDAIPDLSDVQVIIKTSYPGPDATGVGWVYSYALTDKSGNHDLSQLRSLQDWFLKYELQTVPA